MARQFSTDFDIQLTIAKDPNAAPDSLKQIVEEIKDRKFKLFADRPFFLPSDPLPDNTFLEEKKLQDIRIREIFAAVARHPNTPTKTLIRLGECYLIEIGLNPALENIIAENSSFVDELYDPGMHDVFFKEENIPLWYLQKAFNSEKSEIRMVVARNLSTPQAILERLALDPNPRVRAYLARNKNISPNIFSRLAFDRDRDVRTEIAANKNVPKSFLKQLATDESSDVRLAVAANKNASPEILDKLSSDEDPLVVGTVVENEKTSLFTLEKLSNCSSSYVRSLVAIHQNCDRELLNKLSRDRDRSVRKCAAANPKISTSSLLRLLLDFWHCIFWG